ncbi:MAG: signal peptidase [Gammaproteobacteria bacterium]|jgi:signal peptidase II|nr:signal peptidase [Gammaproteobacteria bacterium]
MSTATGGSAAARSGWLWLPLTVIVIAIDQLSKLWIVRHLAEYERVTLLPVLDITLWYNKGAAFSFLGEASGWQRWLFSGLAFVVAVGLIAWLKRLNGRAQWLLSCALALILAGAIGNVIDRLRIGHVVDFILVHWDNSPIRILNPFPAFNVADSAITIGAAFLLFDAWRESRGAKRASV